MSTESISKSAVIPVCHGWAFAKYRVTSPGGHTAEGWIMECDFTDACYSMTSVGKERSRYFILLNWIQEN